MADLKHVSRSLARAQQAVLNGRWADVSPPTGWLWSLPFTIQKRGKRFKPEPSFNLQSHANVAVTKTYYVDKETGSNSNNGLDWEHAFATIGYAFTKTDYDRIYVKGGYYYWSEASSGLNPSRSFELIGDGDVYWTSDVLNQVGTWSEVDNHYEAAYTYDLHTVRDGLYADAWGDDEALTERASVAEVDANAGSWYWASGVIYLRLKDDRAPDSNVRTIIGYGNFNMSRDSLTAYIKNIQFRTVYGSDFSNLSATGGMKVYMENCSLIQQGSPTPGGNGISVEGIEEAIFLNVTVAHTYMDAFYGIPLNGIQTKIIEINCLAYDVGHPTAYAANGSTVHHANSAVRIMGEYHHSRGPSIMDIGGGQGWLLGCYGHHAEPYGSVGPTQRSNFCAGDSSGFGYEMWCDSCTSRDSDYDYVTGGVNSSIHKRNCSGDAGDDSSAGGTIDSY